MVMFTDLENGRGLFARVFYGTRSPPRGTQEAPSRKSQAGLLRPRDMARRCLRPSVGVSWRWSTPRWTEGRGN